MHACLHEETLPKGTVPGEPFLDTLEERISPDTSSVQSGTAQSET